MNNIRAAYAQFRGMAKPCPPAPPERAIPHAFYSGFAAGLGALLHALTLPEDKRAEFVATLRAEMKDIREKEAL